MAVPPKSLKGRAGLKPPRCRLQRLAAHCCLQPMTWRHANRIRRRLNGREISAWPSAGTCIAWHPICHMRRVSTSANGWCSRQSLQQSASSSLLSSWVAPWSLTIFKTSSFYGLLQLFEGTISNGISCTPASGFPESVWVWVTLRRLRD